MAIAKNRKLGNVFEVWNATDGIQATWTAFRKRERAEAFARDFPLRVARQGYWLTFRRERICPCLLELEIIERSALR